MSIIEAYLANNARYAAGFASGGLAAAPTKRIALVACMDARLDLQAMLGLAHGDAHIIRNAGGVVTDDVIRSLTISQHLLGTREIMLIQHTGCGMLTFTDAELAAAIHRETGVRPPFTMGAFPALDHEVRRGIGRIEACPFLKHKDVVRGFVYDVETGRLREVN
jgi:carbonic anhydrase